MKNRRQQGFTLIEILVSLVVFAVGLLALSALLNRSLATNHAAYLGSQATILAQSMMDMIRANPTVRYQVALNEDPRTPATLCDQARLRCAPAEIANLDVFQWLTTLQTVLPQGDGQIEFESETINNGAPAAGPEVDDLVFYRITIQWLERDSGQFGEQEDTIRTFTLETL